MHVQQMIGRILVGLLHVEKGSWLAVGCKWESLSKFKEIFNTSVQIIPIVVRMLNCYSLFSYPCENHSKEEEILPYIIIQVLLP
jgi:hypothetical protein